MMALALGPGREVLIDGLSIRMIVVQSAECRVRSSEYLFCTLHSALCTLNSALLPFPTSALRAILQDDPLREQALADAIGLAKLAPPARVLAGLNCRVDLFERDRRRRVF